VWLTFRTSLVVASVGFSAEMLAQKKGILRVHWASSKQKLNVTKEPDMMTTPEQASHKAMEIFWCYNVSLAKSQTNKAHGWQSRPTDETRKALRAERPATCSTIKATIQARSASEWSR
jgi:hypothetical protein